MTSGLRSFWFLSLLICFFSFSLGIQDFLRLDFSHSISIFLILTLFSTFIFALSPKRSYPQFVATPKTYPLKRAEDVQRRRLGLPILIVTPSSQTFSVVTYDVSSEGAFIAYDEMSKGMNSAGLIGKRTGLKVGDRIRIEIFLGPIDRVIVRAKVVRFQEKGIGDYPKGIGVAFLHLGKKEKGKLKEALRDIEVGRRVA